MNRKYWGTLAATALAAACDSGPPPQKKAAAPTGAGTAVRTAIPDKPSKKARAAAAPRAERSAAETDEPMEFGESVFGARGADRKLSFGSGDGDLGGLIGNLGGGGRAYKRKASRRFLNRIAGRRAPEPKVRPRHDTEEYASTPDRPFEPTMSKPLSTLAIDVDTAAYANVRRFLRHSRLPPPDAVRIEELLNYFEYDYPAPGPEDGGRPFAVHTEVSRAPWAPEHLLARVGLQGRRIVTSQLPASNLTFLIDVSGSMQAPDKLPLLKAAFKLLSAKLRPKDRVAIVVYAGRAGLVLPTTTGGDKRAIADAIDGLQAGGSTAGGEGIRLAYEVAQKSFIQGGNNRVVLATDGDFNVGVSSTSELARLIEDKRKTGIYLTVLGFGRGNYKDARMEELSNKGNGNAAYIDSLREAKKVLITEMGGTLVTIAKDVKVQVEFNPAHVKAWRLLGYENRRLAAQDFNDDDKDAGELGAGHSVTALYELIPATSNEPIPGAGIDPLKYQAPPAPTPAAAGSGDLMTVKLRYKPPTHDKSKLITHVVPASSERPPASTSADHRFATAVAEYGLLLRNDPHKSAASWPALVARAKASVGPDPHGYRREFTELAETASLIVAGSP